MSQGNQDDHEKGGGSFREHRNSCMEVGPEGDCRQGNRRGKPRQDRDKGCHEAEGRMIDLGEIGVFAAGARNPPGKLRIRERPAK